MEFLGHRPVMGFTGIVQVWDNVPDDKENWVKVDFYDSSGYLKLSSAPKNRIEWVLILIAGPLFTIILFISGLFIFLKSNSPKLKMLGFITSFINTFGFILFPITYFTTSGDTAFIAYNLGIPKAFIELPYQFLKGLILIFLIYILIKEKRINIIFPILLGGFIVIFTLLQFNKITIQNVLKHNKIFQPFMDFSLPVFILHIFMITGFIIYLRKTK